MFENIADRFRNATDVIFSDKARFGGVLLTVAIILVVASVATLTPSYFGLAPAPPSNVCNQSYYIYPLFTEGVNSAAIAAQLSCLGSSTPIWAIGLYYLELLALIMVVLYAGIMILNLQG